MTNPKRKPRTGQKTGAFPHSPGCRQLFQHLLALLPRQAQNRGRLGVAHAPAFCPPCPSRRDHRHGCASQGPTGSHQRRHHQDAIRRLSENIILASVNGQPAAYDTSTDGLLALKKAGVSDAVVAAMISRNAAMKSGVSQPRRHEYAGSCVRGTAARRR